MVQGFLMRLPQEPGVEIPNQSKPPIRGRLIGGFIWKPKGHHPVSGSSILSQSPFGPPDEAKRELTLLQPSVTSKPARCHVSESSKMRHGSGQLGTFLSERQRTPCSSLDTFWKVEKLPNSTKPRSDVKHYDALSSSWTHDEECVSWDDNSTSAEFAGAACSLQWALFRIICRNIYYI